MMCVKDYRLVIREADRRVFNQIVTGQKTIETRAATGKYRNVGAGDRLTFQCGGDSVTKTVAGSAHYGTLDELYRQVPVAKVLPSARSLEEAKQVHLSFPGYQAKIEAHGVMAFELK